jgi:hypothetical protein
MNRIQNRTRRFVLLTAVFAVMAQGSFAQQASRLAGHWEGAIEIPDKEMRLAVDLAKNPQGEWLGSVSLPKVGVADAPLIGIAIGVNETEVHFRMGIAHDAFDGKLSEDGNVLVGTAKSDEGTAPFQLKRTGEANVKLPPPSTFLSKDFEGAWEGILDISGQQLRAVLRLARASSGLATGTLISVDQGGQEFPITTITQKDRQLQFEIRLIRVKYTGILNGTGSEIAGEYAGDGLTLPLVFKRAASDIKKP